MKTQHELDDDRMEAAILFLVKHYTQQPKLEEIVSHVNMSSFHFQRMFRQWVASHPNNLSST